MSRALTGPLSFGVSKAIAQPEGVGVQAPAGFILLVDSDGYYLTDADGYYLVEPI